MAEPLIDQVPELPAAARPMRRLEFAWWLVTVRSRRQTSLRRLAEREVGRALDSRAWWRRAWDGQPRLVTFGIAAVAVAVTVLPAWSRFPYQPHLKASVGSLITVAVGLLGAEVGLFVLTAAVTAIVFGALTDSDERRGTLTEYRERAFDAVAAMTLVIVALTGLGLAELMTAEVAHSDAPDWYGRLGLLFLIDLVGSGWLLIYSHHLVSTTPAERIPRVIRLLQRSLRAAAVREVSINLLRQWGGRFGLKLEVDFFGSTLVGVAIVNPRHAFVRDIRLVRLAHWLRSLNGEVAPGTKAITPLNLNVTALPGWPIATVGAEDESRGSHLMGTIEWRATSPDDEFEAALNGIVDRAAKAAREGRSSELEPELDALAAIFVEMAGLRARTTHLQGSWLIAWTGWPPESLFRDRIARLGNQVLTEAPAFIVRRWLYFPHELLVESRAHLDRPLNDVFHIWAQVPREGEVGEEWDIYWQRLHEYALNIRMWLNRAPTTFNVLVLQRELFAFLEALRWVLLSVSATQYVQVRGVIAEVMGRFRNQHRRAQGNETTQALAKLGAELDRRWRVLWLGYAGWLLRRMERGEVEQEVVLRQWSQLAADLGDFSGVLQAWRDIGSDRDPFQWEWEESRRQLQLARAEGRSTAGGFSDPRAGTTLPLVLLGMRMAGAPTPTELGRVLTELKPTIDQVAAAPEKWKPFLERDVVEAGQLLTLRLREAAHRADAELEHQIAATTPDPERVREMLGEYLRGVDHDGLRVVRSLDEGGQVTFVSDLEEAEQVGIRHLVPKGSLLPELSLPLILPPSINLGEREDVAVLQPFVLGQCRVATSVENLAHELESALNQLAARGTPASHIIIPWDFELAQSLVVQGGGLRIDGRLRMGSYRDVPLFRGPLPWPTNIVMVFALTQWLRLRVATPGADPLHSRFSAVIRPPTTEEIAARQAPMNSSADLPFVDDDLTAAQENEWVLEIEERFAVDVDDSEAMKCLELRLGGEPPSREKPRRVRRRTELTVAKARQRRARSS
jgi:hypothetical protein